MADVTYSGVLIGSDGSKATVERMVITHPAPTPDPAPPPAPAPVVPDTVRIGAATYPLSGTNPTPASNPAGAGFPGCRGKDQLVAYQRPGVAGTVTNRWGVEVAVASDGQVVDVRPGGGPTQVPVGGLVLSGNGTAASWLLERAFVGSRVELVRAAPEPAPGPATPPVPASPARTIAMYLKRGSVGSVQLAAAAAAGVNQARVAFLQGNPLALVDWPGSEPVPQLAAGLAALRTAGGTSLVSVGGAQGRIPGSDPVALASGVRTAAIPLDGWDVDIEASSLDVAAVVRAALSLASGREGMWVTSFTPSGGPPVARNLDAARQCVAEGLRVQFGQQLYDTPVDEAAMLRQTGLAVDTLGDPSMVLVGMMIGGDVRHWTLSECEQIMAAAVREWPEIGGAYLWTETGTEAPAWARAMVGVLS